MPIEMKRPTKTVELCTDLSLTTEHERAEEALRAAEADDANDPRLAKKKTSVAAAKAVQEIEQRMTDATLVFTLTAMPRKEWTELEGQHEPREDNTVDEGFGVDLSTFPDAVMPLSITSVTRKATGEEVPFDAATEWEPLADQMTNGQWEAFAIAVMQLNRSSAAPDFSRAASRVIRGSASR